MSVIKDVQKHEENWAWYGQMIEDIKHVLSGRPSWRIQYVPRERNLAAHRLARYDLAFEEEIVWLEDGPDWIKNCIHLEKTMYWLTIFYE